jgi:hypothetical protein
MRTPVMAPRIETRLTPLASACTVRVDSLNQQVRGSNPWRLTRLSQQNQEKWSSNRRALCPARMATKWLLPPARAGIRALPGRDPQPAIAAQQCTNTSSQKRTRAPQHQLPAGRVAPCPQRRLPPGTLSTPGHRHWSAAPHVAGRRGPGGGPRGRHPLAAAGAEWGARIVGWRRAQERLVCWLAVPKQRRDPGPTGHRPTPPCWSLWHGVSPPMPALACLRGVQQPEVPGRRLRLPRVKTESSSPSAPARRQRRSATPPNWAQMRSASP